MGATDPAKPAPGTIRRDLGAEHRQQLHARVGCSRNSAFELSYLRLLRNDLGSPYSSERAPGKETRATVFEHERQSWSYLDCSNIDWVSGVEQSIHDVYRRSPVHNEASNKGRPCVAWPLKQTLQHFAIVTYWVESVQSPKALHPRFEPVCLGC